MKLIEHNTIDNNLYLVCEFFDGVEILDILDKRGAMSEENAKKCIFNVFKGTSHMHNYNIIHRDLKLENILINMKEGKIKGVKIIDLGLGTKIYGEASGF